MRLPLPPSPEELQAHTPSIGPVPAGTHRPFWSVMIPTYNCGIYLKRTLESVLCQAAGPDEMQIEVVDGCSTEDDPEEMVKELGKGRVSFYRLPRNQGPSHTFNTCIERSRGHWVHILHADDMVLPGFYEAYQKNIKDQPNLSLVCGRVVRIDEQDRWLNVGELPPFAGMQSNDAFAIKQAVKNFISFPTVVVPRATYEKVGGFCTLFQHVEDMDMWFRAGCIGQVVFIPQAYSCYRIHSNSHTSHAMITATNIREHYFLALINIARLQQSNIVVNCPWKADLAGYAEGITWRFIESNNLEGATHQAYWAFALRPNYRRLKLILKVYLKYMLSRMCLALSDK
jgi:GT2 family glycosyltransferase